MSYELNPPIYYSRRKNSENGVNEFFQIGSKQIKTGLVNWSKKIKSKTHFEAITTLPSVYPPLVLVYSIKEWKCHSMMHSCIPDVKLLISDNTESCIPNGKKVSY